MYPKKVVTVILIMLALAVTGYAQNVIYSWASPNGVVAESGGKVLQHNGVYVSRVNYRSSGYYTIQLCGKKENILDEDNSLNSVYFSITLSDGNTFKSGDKITITAMRNNDDGGKSNIHFVYGNGTIFDDTNTWANLGQMHEMTISGGTGAKAMIGIPSAQGSGTEPVGEFSLEPSTNTFTVPEAADGSATLTLTRNESECMLYITKLDITRDTSTEITNTEWGSSHMEMSGDKGFTLSGLPVGKDFHGMVIKNGKKIIK